MGKKGREIVEADVKSILKALQAAYADEWLAHYDYLHAAQIAVGINAPQVSGLLKKRAEAELNHALQLGERILELSGELPDTWERIPVLANAKRVKLPQDPGDLKGILRAVLASERSAIETYQRLLKATLHKDTVTHELAEELLADEVKDEEETENLLGE